MRTTSAIDALFPRTRQRILAATFIDPQRWWYMRELARRIGVAPSSLQRELDSMAQGGILLRRRAGKNVYFKAATDSPIFAELHGLVLKTVGLADTVHLALKPFVRRIRWAFIYGSMASSSEHSASDIDLMVIGSPSLAALSSALRATERKLERAVNPAIYPAEEFAAKVKSGHPLIASVMRGSKIFVLGDPLEFDRTFGE